MSQQAPPRILLPITHPLGGIKTYNIALIRALSDSGFAFTVLAPAGEAFDQFQQETEHFPHQKFIAVADGKTSSKKMILAIRKTLRQGDLTVMHSQGLRIGFLAALANWGIHVPHVMTLHGVIVPQEDVPGKAKWLKKRFIAYATRHIDTIIPVSNDCRENHLEQFPQWKKGPCRIKTVLNGIDLARFDHVEPSAELSVEAPIRKQYDLGPETTLIGFFGRYMPEKGFLSLLEGIKILAARGFEEKIRLIATRDDAGYLEYIRMIETDAVLRKMVIQIPQQSNISPLIRQMDLVVMPSLWESCPLVPMESMILGVPFIGSDSIGIREVIRDTPCRAAIAGNAVSIADEIENAIRHPWVAQAREFMPIARERFDFKRCAEQIREIYLASHQD